ncbi:MAG: adenylate/guanylate cyclase domain-containing protein [Gammaproteobacteria bacterium]|nr:adenylate/guanylate cyclase domain-containing protein [Gammaproteobacteria bacterium]
MARENIETAVMFADVVDSTPLYETLGDETANRVIGKAMDLMAMLTRSHQGEVVKIIGDEIMCRFPSADDCVNAARGIHEGLAQGLKDEDAKILVQIGLHYGPAILMDDGDLFGDAVNVAHRMSEIANGNQIITTADTFNMLSPVLQGITREFDRINVKGKSGVITVHQIVWEETDDVTTLEISAPAEESVRYLNLEYKGKMVRLTSEENREFTIGRSVQSDLQCETRLASRTHAKIAFKRGKFLLNDQSSNGTFVVTDEGENIFVKRQEIMLWGSGTIGLGQEISLDCGGETIRYTCE